jgi:hypothetical protein
MRSWESVTPPTAGQPAKPAARAVTWRDDPAKPATAKRSRPQRARNPGGVSGSFGFPRRSAAPAPWLNERLGIIPHFRRSDHRDLSPVAGGNEILTILRQSHALVHATLGIPVAPSRANPRSGRGQPARPAAGRRSRWRAGRRRRARGAVPGPRSGKAHPAGFVCADASWEASNPAGLGFVRVRRRSGSSGFPTPCRDGPEAQCAIGNSTPFPPI